jgi:hypothetical protein
MRTLPFALAGLGLIALAGLLHAGPLDPPAGDIAPSYKTLAQVEPRTAIPGGVVTTTYTITQPGSYYLTENLKVSGSNIGIQIKASNVTIDLNGFSISAANPAAAAAIDVVEFESPLRCITVKNGSVHGTFTQGAIRLDYTRACLVDNITVSDNSDYGIGIGEGGIVSNCRAYYCMKPFSGDRATFTNCTATGTFSSGSGFTLIASTARFCSAFDSLGSGFTANSECLIESCTARYNAAGGGNGGSNILLNGVGNRVDSCTISGGYSAIRIAQGSTDNIVTRNTFRRGSGWGIIQGGQVENAFPGNHVAQVINDPASPVTTTNPLANIQH